MSLGDQFLDSTGIDRRAVGHGSSRVLGQMPLPMRLALKGL
jgi:hypothetical protein